MTGNMVGETPCCTIGGPDLSGPGTGVMVSGSVIRTRYVGEGEPSPGTVQTVQYSIALLQTTSIIQLNLPERDWNAGDIVNLTIEKHQE